MLWAPPFEQAWNRKEVALFWDTKTSSLFVRVLTQELMTTPLMHYRTSAMVASPSLLFRDGQLPQGSCS
ncbi:hypothetical protein WJX82_011083 [Trebouxia sp. C0006]